MSTDVAASTVNEPFLREVLGWIEQNQHLWNQASWVRETECGTSYCLAGWAVHLATGQTLTRADLEARTVTVADEARKLLGFTWEQAGRLFYFTSVWPAYDDKGYGIGRPRFATFAEFCAKVEEVTGVRYKPAEELTSV